MSDSQDYKFDGNKVQVQLIDPYFIEGLGKALTHGAKKYEPHSWQKVDNAEDRYSGALFRHFLAYRQGETTDPESGLSHLFHIAACTMFLAYFERLEQITRPKYNKCSRPIETPEEHFARAYSGGAYPGQGVK